MIFIAPNGKLYLETRIFHKACHEIVGVDTTELWGDAFNRNLIEGDEVLIPGDLWLEMGQEFIEHKNCITKFIEQGGGVRLNLDY